jgi:Protein of unknown function (DUF1353)
MGAIGAFISFINLEKKYMNSKLKKLKATVDKIDKKAAQGSVLVTMSKGKKEAKTLVVEENKSNSNLGLVSAAKATASAPQALDIDFNEVEVTDKDIREIVENAPKGNVPQVNVTYNVARKTWILTSKCSYKTDDGWTITAPKGYETDLASIPRFLWAIISSFELSLSAPLFHDLLYRCGGDLPDGQLTPVKVPKHKFKRKDADNIFKELMKKEGVSKLKYLSAYQAVRTFAAPSWKGK